jgi:uncharacterized membrane protein
MEQMSYLPLTPGFFLILVGIFVLLLVLIQLGLLRYAYMQLGVSSGGAMLLLIATLVGSYFNIPLTEIGERQAIRGAVIEYFGMRYAVPVEVRWPGTVLAVNVGGAVIPTLMSFYLLTRYNLWVRGGLATAGVTLAVHWMAQPVPGLGIAVPVFVPALVTVVLALILARESGARVAYVAGSLGTLIGADLLNLGVIGQLGAPIASIGGAGTFDGIFLIGILAVLLASLATPRPASA